MKVRFTLQRYELLEILLPVLRSRMAPGLKLAELDFDEIRGDWDEDMYALTDLDSLTIAGEMVDDDDPPDDDPPPAREMFTEPPCPPADREDAA